MGFIHLRSSVEDVSYIIPCFNLCYLMKLFEGIAKHHALWINLISSEGYNRFIDRINCFSSFTARKKN